MFGPSINRFRGLNSFSLLLAYLIADTVEEIARDNGLEGKEDEFVLVFNLSFSLIN